MCMKEVPSPAADRLELLQTFVRIVEAGSLSAAARLLATTQPTISRRLQALERSLGLRLLQRSTHAMKLTEDGERCFAHAKELLERWEDFEADARGARSTPRGTLRVLVPHAFGQDQLMPPLLDFLAAHPQISVDWMLHDHPPDFIAEGIDCAIRVGAVDDPSVVAVRLARISRIVVAAPGLWGEGPPPAEPQALAALPWVALSLFYRDELRLVGPGGRVQAVAVAPRLSTDSVYATRRAVLGGAGAALVSAWVVAQDLAAGRLVRLLPQWEAEALPVTLVYPYASHYSPRLRAFVAWMRGRVSALDGMG
ncbi:LysR family transcriptional regulator [Xenophilus sp.]|uniref:LysR family transcriptional regulator n=1 Tax=Xenophilus sp. TaxID=1873499 RepID=UPI0037DC7744